MDPNTLGAQTGNRSLSSNISSLNSDLNSGFAPTERTIMQNYAQAKALTQQSTANLNTATADRYQQDINYQNQQNQNQGTSMLESGRGFVVNPGAIVAFQQQADKRVKDLRNQMNDALLANNATGAKALSDLIVNEQSAITNARTAFLNQYFGTAQEARSQAGFQTPEQQAVQTLSTQYPDAGVLPTDSLQAAAQKVKGAQSYQININKGNADIQNALAQAGLAGAQSGLATAEAGQISRLLGFLPGSNGTSGGSSPYQNDVDALMNGTATPQQIQDKYSNFPGGMGGAIYNSIITAAQQQGYDLNKGTLSGVKNQANAQALGSGNPLSMMGAGLGNAIDWSAQKILNVPGARTLTNPWTGTTQNGLQYSIH